MHKAVRRLQITLALALALAFALSTGASAQEFKEVPLTEKQIEGFINAQKDFAALAKKMPGGPGDKPDPKVIQELESIAKKHAFASFSDYNDVAANIGVIMSGIDPKTKSFSEPPEVLKKEIEEITANKSIPAKEKGQILEELNRVLKAAQPLKQRANIELVKKYYDRIDAAVQ